MRSYVCTKGQGERSQDRAAIFEGAEGLILVVADGAGGTARGEAAAEAVLQAVAMMPRGSPPSAEEFCVLLQQLDIQLQRLGGESTAVIASVSARGISGASVGDSIAWLITDNDLRELSAQQQRKPLLGSGAATPVSFQASPVAGVLLLASDGLWKYATESAICEAIRTRSVEAASEHLLRIAQRDLGRLQDDLSVVLCSLP